MEGFDAASFWAGLGLGLVNGIALACLTLAWPGPALGARITSTLQRRPISGRR